MLARLPQLAVPTGKKLSDSVVHGLRAAFQNTFMLADLSYRGPYDHSFVPDPKVDLRIQNAARRKAMTLDASKDVFMQSLNTGLSGGKDYPVLTGVLSIAAGMVSAGAGAMFTLTTAAMSASRSSQSVQARQGDEIWHLEWVGKDGGDLKHLEYFVLRDPFRANHGNVASEWVIHEERRDLKLA